ncbi:MAG: DNA helicase II [Porticoccaceae bacterium]
MDSSPLLAPLNPAQRDAVSNAGGHLLVLAGAGSGKTRVLVHRIAWLVRTEGLSLYEILAVTFTNKAAREMRERLDSLLGGSLRGMWVGTFHGLAHRLLKAHWRDAGLRENFQILDADDQLRLVKRVCASLDIDAERWPPRQAQWFINAQKDEGLRARHIAETPDLVSKTMLRIYRGYEDACARGGMVDFGELLLRAHELWLDKPEILRHYQARFRHILVDEFQDTNAIQYAWLRVLTGDSARVTAVGDDDQSIYGWRGARIENIQHFSRDFATAGAPVQTVRLEQNYRSTATILAAANAVIARNADRLGKQLWTDGEDGERISLYAAFNELDEARFVADRIDDWARAGNARRDIAILYRSNAQSRVLEEALLRVQIPYHIHGGHRFYERLEIRNATAYLRLLVNRDDDAAFERVINLPTRGIGDKTLQELRDAARADNTSLWRATAKLAPQLPPRAAGAVLGFLDLIEALAVGARERPLDELAEDVLKRSGLRDFHGREKGERGQARLENLDELVSACRAFAAEDAEQPALTQFLDQAALDAGEHQADGSEDAVQLMTLHSAKGLEFPLVFMVGMEENLFPHKMSAEEPGRLEEERRLCYVGITRAMRKLYLTFAESRRLHGSDSFNALSRFVRDIPGELLDEVRVKAQISRPTSYAKAAGSPTASAIRFSDTGANTGLALGQRVTHKTFGEGTVLAFEGNGANARIQVNFRRDGTKWLVMQYAKLEAV